MLFGIAFPAVDILYTGIPKGQKLTVRKYLRSSILFLDLDIFNRKRSLSFWKVYLRSSPLLKVGTDSKVQWAAHTDRVAFWRGVRGMGSYK